MSTFRTRRPIVVEAEQFLGDWRIPGICRGTLSPGCDGRTPFAHIHTPNGTIVVDRGSWVVRGVDGEYYPCADSIFHMVYEPVEEGPSADDDLSRGA